MSYVRSTTICQKSMCSALTPVVPFQNNEMNCIAFGLKHSDALHHIHTITDTQLFQTKNCVQHQCEKPEGNGIDIIGTLETLPKKWFYSSYWQIR